MQKAPPLSRWQLMHKLHLRPSGPKRVFRHWLHWPAEGPEGVPCLILQQTLAIASRLQEQVRLNSWPTLFLAV